MVTYTQITSTMSNNKHDSTGHYVLKDDVGYASSHAEDDGSNVPNNPYVPGSDILLDFSLTNGSGDWPTAGTSMFNVQVAQETRITDGAGNDITTYNDNNLVYGLSNTGFGVVESNKVDFSTLTNFFQVAAAYPGPPAGNGNEDVIYSNLATVFNEPILYTVVLMNSTNTAILKTATDYMPTPEVWLEGVSVNGGVDIPDNVAFNVGIEVLKGEGGVRQDRFDGTSEHKIKVSAYYKSDDPDTIIDSQEAFITAGTPLAGKSGVNVSFTIDIPEIRKTTSEDRDWETIIVSGSSDL